MLDRIASGKPVLPEDLTDRVVATVNGLISDLIRHGGMEKHR